MDAHLTPAQARHEVYRLIDTAESAVEALRLYEDVYADEVHDEVMRLLGAASVRLALLRRRHAAAHKEAAALADSVHADLERITVVGPDRHEDWNRTEEEQ